MAAPGRVGNISVIERDREPRLQIISGTRRPAGPSHSTPLLGLAHQPPRCGRRWKGWSRFRQGTRDTSVYTETAASNRRLISADGFLGSAGLWLRCWPGPGSGCAWEVVQGMAPCAHTACTREGRRIRLPVYVATGSSQTDTGENGPAGTARPPRHSRARCVPDNHFQPDPRSLAPWFYYARAFRLGIVSAGMATLGG